MSDHTHTCHACCTDEIPAGTVQAPQDHKTCLMYTVLIDELDKEIGRAWDSVDNDEVMLRVNSRYRSFPSLDGYYLETLSRMAGEDKLVAGFCFCMKRPDGKKFSTAVQMERKE